MAKAEATQVEEATQVQDFAVQQNARMTVAATAGASARVQLGANHTPDEMRSLFAQIAAAGDNLHLLCKAAGDFGGSWTGNAQGLADLWTAQGYPCVAADAQAWLDACAAVNNLIENALTSNPALQAIMARSRRLG